MATFTKPQLSRLSAFVADRLQAARAARAEWTRVFESRSEFANLAEANAAIDAARDAVLDADASLYHALAGELHKVLEGK